MSGKTFSGPIKSYTVKQNLMDSVVRFFGTDKQIHTDPVTLIRITDFEIRR